MRAAQEEKTSIVLAGRTRVLVHIWQLAGVILVSKNSLSDSSTAVLLVLYERTKSMAVQSELGVIHRCVTEQLDRHRGAQTCDSLPHLECTA